jgi:hypothetical protein
VEGSTVSNVSLVLDSTHSLLLLVLVTDDLGRSQTDIQPRLDLTHMKRPVGTVTWPWPGTSMVFWAGMVDRVVRRRREEEGEDVMGDEM